MKKLLKIENEVGVIIAWAFHILLIVSMMLILIATPCGGDTVTYAPVTHGHYTPPLSEICRERNSIGK